MHLDEQPKAFDLMYWTPMGSKYFLVRSLLENVEKYEEKNCRFSGQLQPDWGNTARAAMARLGSIR